ncbi:MAG: HD domain-containing protein [Candidatus Omnitrophica bacterium]|nr:HD domain-containing protein [Candidatus Omnitrophota bacterium]MBU1926013.1 HD domain-containing protein [Candidatus Omnitrophota bacterium]
MDNSVKLYKIRLFKDDRVLKKIASVSKEMNLEIYLVGGALRDLLVEEKRSSNSYEWDFALKRGALKLGRVLAQQLKASFVVLDGKNNIGRLLHKEGGKCYQLDFADFRADSLREDLKLRDFTINTLCLDINNLVSGANGPSYITDYLNAFKDIKERRICVTAPRNFKDDPVRILRAFTFSGRMHFKIAPQTENLIKKNAPALKYVAGERISEELAKILKTPGSFKYILQMDKLRVLENVFPEIKTMRGIDQGDYHHLDVWRHSLETLAQFEKLLKNLCANIPIKYAKKTGMFFAQNIRQQRPRVWLVKLACLFHDIAKPQTKFIGEDEKIHFYTHEKKGADFVQKIAYRLKLSGRETNIFKRMVAYHLRPGQLVNRIPSKKAKFRFFRDLKDEAVPALLLALADRRAMRGKMSRCKKFVFLEDEIFSMLVEFFKEKEKPRPQRLLDGDQIKDLLSIPAGPLIGTVLKMLEEAQNLKQVRTRQEAEELALKVFTKQSTNSQK